MVMTPWIIVTRSHAYLEKQKSHLESLVADAMDYAYLEDHPRYRKWLVS